MPASHATLMMLLVIAAEQVQSRETVALACLRCGWRRQGVAHAHADRLAARHTALFLHDVQVIR